MLPAFLQNPAIAQRELLRQFYMASTSEEQLRLLRQATGEALDLGSRCGALLGGTAASNILPLAGRRWGAAAARLSRPTHPSPPDEPRGSHAEAGACSLDPAAAAVAAAAAASVCAALAAHATTSQR